MIHSIRPVEPPRTGVLATSSVSPRYEQVKRLILDGIDSGRWNVGDQVPSETELVAELGFSRMTVNRALRELSNDGIVIRVQGVGTFVAGARNVAPLLEVQSIAEGVIARGHRHDLTVVAHERVTAPDAASRLGLPEREQVFHSVLVHRENHVPIQYEDRYVNPWLAPDYLEQDFATRTPTAYLLDTVGLTDVEHVVESVLGTPQECAHLKITAGEPCLAIHRRTWHEDRVVTTARLLHPGSRNRLEGRHRPAFRELRA